MCSSPATQKSRQENPLLPLSKRKKHGSCPARHASTQDWFHKKKLVRKINSAYWGLHLLTSSHTLHAVSWPAGFLHCACNAKPRNEFNCTGPAMRRTIRGLMNNFNIFWFFCVFVGRFDRCLEEFLYRFFCTILVFG